MFGTVCGLFLLVVCLTTASSENRLTSKSAAASSVRSIQKCGQHVCNAVQIARELFITPAACLGSSDPSELQLIASEDSRTETAKAQCNVTRFEVHPKYAFLSHNIGIVELKCGKNRHYQQNSLIGDDKNEEYLALVGVNKSLRRVNAYMKLQKCFVCKQEYGTFDCERQICLRPVEKNVPTIEGLAGSAIFNQNLELVGILSYGFATGSFVAERVLYYERFLERTMQTFYFENKVFDQGSVTPLD